VAFDRLRCALELWRIKRAFKFFWQRRTRGFDDSELWSLDWTIVKFIHPRLKAFTKDAHLSAPMHPTETDDTGFPRALTTKEWRAILLEMLDGFEIALDDDLLYPPEGEAGIKIERSLDLFREWFFHLWT